MTDHHSLRHTFNEAASLYHEARPRYPDDLFSALIDSTEISGGAKLLEIGPGTGQATKPLAEKGFDITAIELGEALAEIAKYELRDYENIQIIKGAFEEIPLPAASFDLVFAATSFHWIDPSLKFIKTHEVLKPKGHLAIIHTHHISDERGDRFFKVSQPIFDRYDFTDKHRKPELPKSKDLQADAIDERLFRLINFKRFPVVITYSAKSFVQLLGTFSNHLAATKEVQHAFFEEIENLIHDKFQGKIDKHFSMSLTVAEKL
ncbi:class I SAM-dependent methyltransferase [Chryseolinea soli]|uniref:Methyltransferase domain-containing protein n=1 Tax=Chryseolinea soli TaxID=2321403 RepID=A0A385SLI2_9BACT|nr:class I SAM-dependent methyltransferase [Chryseolinea soli]AYB31672.1 methyltransferase domain-containing protein [Chryseolinea soli]